MTSIYQIGLGIMGRNHAKALAALAGQLSNVTVAAVFDTDPRAAEHATNLGLPLANGLTEALSQANDGSTAAVVASPTSTHAAVLREVGQSIHHIFLEKPLAATLPEAEALAAWVATQGLHVQLGFMSGSTRWCVPCNARWQTLLPLPCTPILCARARVARASPTWM